MTRLTTLDLPSFHRATIGFDRLFDELERSFQNSPNGNGYPPYNIAQINEDEYMISLAVAGFGMDNLEITKDGNVLKIEERKFVQFYGMSSKSANEKHFGGLKDYRSSEGRTVLVPYRGSVGVTVQEILGGIRSACTYAGAVRLKHLSKCTTFVRCTQTHNNVYEKSTIGN